MGTRDRLQIKWRLEFTRRHNKYLPKFEKQKRWTADEVKTFMKIVAKHGINWDLLKKALPNRKIDALYYKRIQFRKKIEENPKHEYAHLYENLQSNHWTSQQDQLMLDRLKAYPKVTNYK